MATRTRRPHTWDSANFSWNSNQYQWNDVFVLKHNDIAFVWDQANFSWSTNPYTWSDCAFVREIANIVGGGGGYHDAYKHLKHPERKKKFVKLLCKVQGKEYEETKEIADYKIVISDVELVIQEVLGKIKIEL